VERTGVVTSGYSERPVGVKPAGFLLFDYMGAMIA
jgi:hypothetical protein